MNEEEKEIERLRLAITIAVPRPPSVVSELEMGAVPHNGSAESVTSGRAQNPLQVHRVALEFPPAHAADCIPHSVEA